MKVQLIFDSWGLLCLVRSPLAVMLYIWFRPFLRNVRDSPH
jgi:hypothetical protein